MASEDERAGLSDDLLRELADLTVEQQAEVRQYILYLRWHAANPCDDPRLPDWQYSLLDDVAGANVSASREQSGMEVKVAETAVGGETRMGLWHHPPVTGESMVEMHVPVPAGVTNLRLRFAIGIRDGSGESDGRMVAFRVRVGGWQVWNRAGWPRKWEAVEVSLPFQEGDVLRLTFVTDGLGDHRYAWAVWGEPMLIGSWRG